MATPDGKNQGGTEIELSETKPGFFQRLKFAITGTAPDEWFGPGAPLAPAAPDEVKGRQFDYPFGANLSYQPRGEQGENLIGFATLRRLAEPAAGGFDLIRLAIETRKDQMSGLEWGIKGRDKRLGDGGERARAIESALRRPDGVNSFRVWQRMLLEDLLVIDAPVVYINRLRGKVKLPPLPPLKPTYRPKPKPAPGEAPPFGGEQPDPNAPPPPEGEEPTDEGKKAPPFGKAAPPPRRKKPAEEEPAQDDDAPPTSEEEAPLAGKPADRPDAENSNPDDGEEPEEGAEGEDGEEFKEPPVALHTADEVGVLVEAMDGATIKKLIREDGRTPLPPDPAYVQNIKGLPANHYDSRELLYSPRNVRTNRIYGMSPVEQVLTTINIALRRQLSQLEYYTAGTVPDMMVGVPETWTQDQIKQFQAWFDILLTGDSAERRKVRFVPGGTTPMMLKDPKIKDEWDEWLARIVCYAFSLSPQALVIQMNRATAETAEKQAAMEGIEPLKLWFKDVMDLVLDVAFDSPELEFTWKDEEITDPKIKSEVWTGLVTAKIATQNEAREAYGLEPKDGLDDLSSGAAAPSPPFGAPPGTGGGVSGEGAPPPRPAFGKPPVPPPPGGRRPPPPPPNGDVSPQKLAALIAAELQKKKRTPPSLRSPASAGRRSSDE